VGAVISFVCCHAIAVSELPVNLRVKVWKRRADVGVEFPNASLIGRGSRLSGVIDEIAREELFKNIEVPFALDLFGISAADDCFGRI
jgi:hypothetical protein